MNISYEMNIYEYAKRNKRQSKTTRLLIRIRIRLLAVKIKMIISTTSFLILYNNNNYYLFYAKYNRKQIKNIIVMLTHVFIFVYTK